MFGFPLEYIWILAGLILLGLEFALPGAFVMFLGIGALAAGIATRIWSIDLPIQIMVFVISTLVSVFLLGSFIKKLFKSDSSKDPFIKDDYLNKIVTVEEEVLQNQMGGKVRFQGTIWDAISQKGKIPKGEKVQIVSRNNLTFTVETISLSDDNSN